MVVEGGSIPPRLIFFGYFFHLHTQMSPWGHVPKPHNTDEYPKGGTNAIHHSKHHSPRKRHIAIKICGNAIVAWLISTIAIMRLKKNSNREDVLFGEILMPTEEDEYEIVSTDGKHRITIYPSQFYEIIGEPIND